MKTEVDDESLSTLILGYLAATVASAGFPLNLADQVPVLRLDRHSFAVTTKSGLRYLVSVQLDESSVP